MPIPEDEPEVTNTPPKPQSSSDQEEQQALLDKLQGEADHAKNTQNSSVSRLG